MFLVITIRSSARTGQMMNSPVRRCKWTQAKLPRDFLLRLKPQLMPDWTPFLDQFQEKDPAEAVGAISALTSKIEQSRQSIAWDHEASQSTSAPSSTSTVTPTTSDADEPVSNVPLKSLQEQVPYTPRGSVFLTPTKLINESRHDYARAIDQTTAEADEWDGQGQGAWVLCHRGIIEQFINRRGEWSIIKMRRESKTLFQLTLFVLHKRFLQEDSRFGRCLSSACLSN